MNILLIHNYYKISGGEDQVVSNEKALLEKHGYKVFLYSRNNQEIDSFSFLSKLLLPFSSIFSLKSYRDVSHIISKENIDIVHVHNTLSLISPSVYWAALHHKVPVIQTLHNYRLFCAAGILYRNQQICLDCPDHGCWHAIRYKCYRNSRLQTLVNIAITGFHKQIGTYGKINYICLSDFSRDFLLRHLGTRFPMLKQQVFVKPNFCDPTLDSHVSSYSNDNKLPSSYYLYVGRLDKAKGIRTVIRAFQSNFHRKLLVIGTGPEEAALQHSINNQTVQTQPSSIQLLGAQTHATVLAYMKKAKALIFSSECYETFGMTIIESYAMGTPVLAANLGSVPTLVQNGQTGFLFEPGNADSLLDCLYQFENANIEQLSYNSRDYYEKYFSGDANYQILDAIYREILQ